MVWELRKGERIAKCEIWTHPAGWEIRVEVDGELRRGAAHRRRESAEDQAADWERLFAAKGWA